jgi:peptidoglycan hydrolase-like protein with peptidoglycan-binding domain
MKNFTNISSSGNERALRRGTRVPDGDVNLAWVKSPKLTTENNIIILDTSRTIDENRIDYSTTTQLMYANSLGILEDENGNQVIEDEYPCIADVFLQDEDFSLVAGNEYTNDDPLPLVHVSRYFHLDFDGLSIGNNLESYESDLIQVITDSGEPLASSQGKRLYRTRLTKAFNNYEAVTIDDKSGIYRLWIFLPGNLNKDYFLKYNKIEISTSGQIINRVTDYKEILNPLPYFQYVPEESDVADPANRRRKIYSTKPMTKKSSAVGKNVRDIEGYRAYVPRKAIADPRLYQLTRWRVKCEFAQEYELVNSEVGPESVATIKAGFITTNDSVSSNGAFMFTNLENSNVNKANVGFTNPYAEQIGTLEQTDAEYWSVNLDQIPEFELLDYDLLVLSPNDLSFDFQSIISKIDYFVNVGNGTLLIDTNGESTISNIGVITSPLVDAVTGGVIISTETEESPVDHTTLVASDPESSIIKGYDYLGGYNLDDTDFDLLTLKAGGSQGKYSHYINSYPTDYAGIVSGSRTNAEVKQMLIGRTQPGSAGTRKGKIYFSTLGLPQTCSSFAADVNGVATVVNDNDDIETIDIESGWITFINSEYVTSAMKLVYNIALSATENKFIQEGNEQEFSSRWAVFSDWESTWVIDGDVLSADERSQNNFVFQPKNATGDTEVFWQRRLSDKNLKQIIDSSLTENSKPILASASRTYSIEVTNSNVGYPTVLDDNTIPRIWTESYSPSLTVPKDFGPHIIKPESFNPEYNAGQYNATFYPAKKYDLQAQRTFVGNAEGVEEQISNVEVKINYTKTTQFKGTTTTTITSGEQERLITWKTHGDKSLVSMARPYAPTKRYSGVWNRQSLNNSNATSWIWWDRNTKTYSQGGSGLSGSEGTDVKFIQAVMNQYVFFFESEPKTYLVEDGIFGPLTAAKVKAFQQYKGARYQFGIVGAETWSIIGYFIQGIAQALNATSANSGTKLILDLANSKSLPQFSNALSHCRMETISDSSTVPFGVITNTHDYIPAVIQDGFYVKFNQHYKIHGIQFHTTQPSITTAVICGGNISDAELTQPPDGSVMYGINERTGEALPVHDGYKVSYMFPERSANIIGVEVKQDLVSSFGIAKVLGLFDLAAYAMIPTSSETTTTIPGETKRLDSSETVTKTITVPAIGSTVVDFSQYIPNFSNEANSDPDIDWIKATNVSYELISQDNPAITATLVGSKLTLETPFQIDGTFSYVQKGNRLPGDNDFEYFSMTPSGRVSTVPETGFVAADEGVKLLCDSEGKPVGIPQDLADSSFSYVEGVISSTSSQLEIRSLGTEENVFYGFYDKNLKTFINEASGSRNIITDATIKSIGLDNIYIAVVSKAGAVTESVDLPSTEDAPSITKLWVMPICYKPNSRIGIDPLPKNLGPMDIWPIPIRVGSFDKQIYIKPRSEQSLTHWTQAYEGKLLHAFYGIPEARSSGWSLLYGRPNIDVKDEVPDLVSSTAIKVRQTPILAITEPYLTSSYADPLRPIFTVYTRNSISDPWVAMPWSNISDYNIANGTIYFKTPLNSSDPNMVKVSYTSARKVYDFRQYNGSNRINLNPYILNDESILNKAIYVYIIPEYVNDENGTVIAQSVSNSTLRWTTDSGIFDSFDSAVYDPLAIKLGVVYITNAADIENLVMVDTRLRGGGIDEYENDAALKQSYDYANDYWDINYGSGEAYQSGGFAIIRLPSELKVRFDEDDTIIRQVIERNIPAGIAYELQDLNGNPWR